VYKEELPGNIGIKDGSLWFVEAPLRRVTRLDGVRGKNKFSAPQGRI